ALIEHRAFRRGVGPAAARRRSGGGGGGAARGGGGVTGGLARGRRGLRAIPSGRTAAAGEQLPRVVPGTGTHAEGERQGEGADPDESHILSSLHCAAMIHGVTAALKEL